MDNALGLGRGLLSVYWANIPYFGGIISRYMTCSDQYPLPHAGTLNCCNWVGGDTER